MKSLIATLAVCLLLTGCGPVDHQFSPPVTSIHDLGFGVLWQQLESTLKIDPSKGAQIAEMEWHFQPDGSLQSVLLRIYATGRGERQPTTYWVTGGPEMGGWRWRKESTIGPHPAWPDAQKLFSTMDRFGFADTQPSTAFLHEFRMDMVTLTRARVFERGQLRDWIPGDEAGHKYLVALEINHTIYVFPEISR